jgi:hypothetical protein
VSSSSPEKGVDIAPQLGEDEREFHGSWHGSLNKLVYDFSLRMMTQITYEEVGRRAPDKVSRPA